MQRGLFLDVVVAQRTPILKLLASKNQALLVRWNAFLILDLGLHVINGIAALDLERNSLSSKRLDEHLHCSIVVDAKRNKRYQDGAPVIRSAICGKR